MRLVRRHPLRAYAVLACALTWAWWLPLALTGTTVGPGDPWPTHLPGLLGPALAAVAVTGLTRGRAGVADLAARALRWRVPLRWYGLVAVTTATVALAPLVAAVRGDAAPAAGEYLAYSGAPAVTTVPGAVAVLGYVLLLNGFGEELGWRGFLAHHLLDRFGRLRTALLVAPVWALWHLPMFWVTESFRGLGPGGTAGWLVGLTAGSVVLTWLYDACGRSVLVVALWHVAFNLTTATAAAGGAPAAVASTIVMVAAVVVAARDRGRAGTAAAAAG